MDINNLNRVVVAIDEKLCCGSGCNHNGNNFYEFGDWYYWLCSECYHRIDMHSWAQFKKEDVLKEIRAIWYDISVIKDNMKNNQLPLP